jgi:protein TonB
MPARPTETLDAAASAVTDLPDPFVLPPAVAPGTEAAPVLAFASPLLARRIGPEPTRTPSPATTLGPQPPAAGAGAVRESTQGPTGESDASATSPSADDPPAASSGPAASGASRTARFRETPARPDYPAIARRRGWEGRVTLRLSLDAEGTVCDVAVASSSGRAALDEAAVEGAFRWRFEPAVEDGRAVPSTVEKAVEFRLLD